MPDEKWDVLGREPLLQHPYVTVDAEQVRLPDGRIIPDWPIIHTGDYINAFVLNDLGEALMIEGYKHGVGRSSLQTMGGYLEKGEDPLLTAQRELFEETGYRSDNWQHLGSFVVDANRRTAIGHFYLARDARPAPNRPEYNDLEQITVHWLPLAEVRQALSDGRVAGLHYAINISLALLALQS